MALEAMFGFAIGDDAGRRARHWMREPLSNSARRQPLSLGRLVLYWIGTSLIGVGVGCLTGNPTVGTLTILALLGATFWLYPPVASFGPIHRWWLLGLCLGVRFLPLALLPFGDGSRSLGFPNITVFLLNGICAPIIEELTIRGCLWEGLQRQHWPTWAVMLVTGLLFLALHGAIYQSWLALLAHGIGAVMLTLTRQYCRSLRATIILHWVGNIIASVLAPSPGYN